MPTYTFRCRKCLRKIEVVHGFNEPHPTTCGRLITLPEWPDMDEKTWMPIEAIEDLSKIPPVFQTKTEVCGGELQRIFDVPDIHYLVSGFYNMDKRLTPVKPEDYNPDED